ncbi:winged helix-turn-helix transcriptional regulator [Mycolicibacterium farcinogenes]|uniref:Helix-turn-helix transcriptional regulator n=1 Tax=Mycolicibacterium farcinogenes TaxID=1802 RepID=A0ACD1FQQ5_MYCFR|nr:helix-turn-helix domain-containing protein [Mycolicibacterium farcinogenes]QZH69406.1 helix-turn-helix transcriptional regulator [Mycolicibacterium farcinogenes]
MAKRSYNQYCGLAAALDLLGDRWSLLLLRNLLLGPQRFKDLLEGLPGIGTAMLTERLKHLESAAVIAKRTLPPPAGSTVYELTTAGEELRPLLMGFSRWGMAHAGVNAGEGVYVAPDLLALGLHARFDPAAAAAAAGTYALHIDDRSYRIEIKNATIRICAGAIDAPRASIRTDTDTLVAIDQGRVSFASSLGTEKLTVDGDPDATVALAHAFGLPV